MCTGAEGRHEERERGEIDEKGRDGKRRREMRRMWMEKKMKVKDLFCICA
jgi:hypothetical protein